MASSGSEFPQFSLDLKTNLGILRFLFLGECPEVKFDPLCDFRAIHSFKGITPAGEDWCPMSLFNLF